MNTLSFIVNNWGDLTAIAILAGGWLWKKAHHQKTESLSDMLLKLGRLALPKILADKRVFNDAWVNEQIRSAILVGLARINVKPTPAVLLLVDKAAVHIHDELAQKLFSMNIDDFVKTQEKTAEILKSATTP